MNPICAACAGQCCSFRGLSLSFITLSDESLKSTLRKMDLMQLATKTGEMAPTRFYDVRDTDFGRRHLIFECAHQDKETGKCGIYKDRPTMCSAFKCDALLGKMPLGKFLVAHAPYKFKRKRDVSKIVEREMCRQLRARSQAGRSATAESSNVTAPRSRSSI